MKLKYRLAFTLAESLITMMILSIIYVVIAGVLRPGDVKKEVLQKSGANMLYQLDFASKQILARNTVNYTLYHLKTSDGTEFLITEDDADEKLMKLFRRYLKGIKNVNLSAAYLSRVLVDETNTTITNVSPSSFKYGFNLSNGTYLAIKLNKNCTTTESYIYSPAQRQKREALRSCGLFFYDVNGEKAPNTLGVDQYIVSVGKNGIK